jgi:hypothetical protein
VFTLAENYRKLISCFEKLEYDCRKRQREVKQ